MKTLRIVVGVALLSALFAAPLWAGDREHRTIESASDATAALADAPLRCIPPALMRDAAGVAVIPHVVKVGFLFDGRFGRGVVLARQPDGTWSNPIFLTLAGGGVGWQAGVESTDVILVFKTRESLRRLMEGKDKVTLGADVAVAAGPVGRQAEAATDAQLKAEIFSYSRSRGLFLGRVAGRGRLADRPSRQRGFLQPPRRPAGRRAGPARQRGRRGVPPQGPADGAGRDAAGRGAAAAVHAGTGPGAAGPAAALRTAVMSPLSSFPSTRC